MNIIKELAEKKSQMISFQIDKWFKEELDKKKIGRMINWTIRNEKFFIARLLARSVSLTIETQQGVNMETNHRLLYANKVIAKKTIRLEIIASS